MNFIVDQAGRLLIGATYTAFGYAWGVGAIYWASPLWLLWLLAATIPAAIGTTLLVAADRERRAA